VGGVVLVGARFCPLPDASSAPHVYYAAATSHVSVFVVRHPVRLGDRSAGKARGRAVRLFRVEGEIVGIVGERESEVRAFETAVRPILAVWIASRSMHRGPSWE
jgi:hypothetical protein